jgi:hypothetical protein
MIRLLSKPSISIEQLHTDAAVAVDVVDPRSVYFRRQLATEWWHQLYSRANSDINVDKERGSSATDFSRFGFGLKRFSSRVCTLHVECKLDWNSRASGPL